MDTGLPDDGIDHNTHSSVVLHVDLDCFYAAVEHVRLGIPKEVPLAVQQWEGLIAINYAARAAGITRHERVHQAIKKCPELQCVHVETIGDESGNVDAPNRGQAKVSLERYRQASASVFTIFRRFSDLCEKASIDEAYLDVTSRVEKMMNQDYNWDQELDRLVGDQEEGLGMVVIDGPLVPFNSYDRRMLAGAIIAEKIRSAVRNELSYTCSVGIATNKLLAKIASAKNKPDKQTLIPPRAVPGLMHSMPLKKIKLLGGKLGEEMTKKWGFATAGEAQALPISALVGCFGDRLGNYVWHAVRGIQADKVQVKQVAKSMLAAKTFQSTKELSDIRRWLSILAEELSVRMLRDFEQNHRHPRLLQLYYRSGDFRHARDHTKSWSMPHAALSLLSTGSASSHRVSEISKQDQTSRPGDEHVHAADLISEEENIPFDEEMHKVEDDCNMDEEAREDHSKDLLGLVVSEKSRSLAKVLEDASYSMFRRLEGIFPCTRLALAASGFQDLPSQGTKSIQDFFSSVGRGKPNSSSPLHGDQRSGPPCNSPNKTKPKPKPKGMLKFFSHEASIVLPEGKSKDGVEHGDQLPDGCRKDVANVLAREDYNPVSLRPPSNTVNRDQKTNSKGLFKFLNHESQLAGPDDVESDVKRYPDGSQITLGVRRLCPSPEAGDVCVDLQISGCEPERCCSSALATSSGFHQTEAETSSWMLNLEDHPATSVRHDAEDQRNSRDNGLPVRYLDENSATTSGVRNGREDECSNVDIGKVDIKEQLRILATIQRSTEQPSNQEGQVRVQVPPINGKRNRQSVSKSGQQSIAKFFRTHDK